MINGQDFRIFVDGKEIGTMQSVPSVTFKNNHVERGTVFKGIISHARINPLMLPPVEVIVTNIIKPLPRTPKSKKKRIQKKWAKRYKESTVQTTYHNAVITGSEAL